MHERISGPRVPVHDKLARGAPPECGPIERSRLTEQHSGRSARPSPSTVSTPSPLATSMWPSTFSNYRDPPEVPLAARARSLIETILTHLAARNTDRSDRPRAPPLHAPLTQPPDSPSPTLS